MKIKRVGVLGFGLKGSGIAQVCAQGKFKKLLRVYLRIIFIMTVF